MNKGLMGSWENNGWMLRWREFIFVLFCLIFQNLPRRNSPLWEQLYLFSTAGLSWNFYGSFLCVYTVPCSNFIEVQPLDLQIYSFQGVVLRADQLCSITLGEVEQTTIDAAPEELTYGSQGFVPWGWCLFVVSWLAKEVIYKGVFLSLSSNCYMFCYVCIHPTSLSSLTPFWFLLLLISSQHRGRCWF